MKLRFLIGPVLLAMPLNAVAAMPVSTFLEKVEALRKKGPLALFSGDIKLIKAEIMDDASQLRAERLAAQAAGRRPAFCPPAGGVKMTDKDVLDAMTAVPPAQRARTDTKDALRAYFGRRFPC